MVHSGLKASIPVAADGQASAPEFGHIGISTSGVFIDFWGAGLFRLGAWLFEDSDRFGPALVNRNGDLKANPYPGEKHPFWIGYHQWRNGGRRMAADGVTCLWDPPRPTLFRRDGRTRFLVEEGDEGGVFREVKDDAPAMGTERSGVNIARSALTGSAQG